MSDRREYLKVLVARMRKKASSVGSMSGLWDVIFDIEAHLAGEPGVLHQTTEQWIADAEKDLGIRSEQNRGENDDEIPKETSSD